MRTFAFLTHPLNNKQLRKIWPFLNIVPDFAVESFLKYCPPFNAYKIKNISLNNGKELEGFLINLSLLPSQIMNMKEEAILDRISGAVNAAVKLGVEIVGLGGLLADKRYHYAGKFKLPVTNGNYFSAWTVVEAIYRLCKVKKVNLKELTVTVIGAQTAIGALCARKLSYYASKIIISGGEDAELARLKTAISILNTCAAEMESDIRLAVNKTDVLVIADSLFNGLINIKDFKSGAIVCDVSPVDNISALVGARQDITIVEAGLIKLPYPVNFPFYGMGKYKTLSQPLKLHKEVPESRLWQDEVSCNGAFKNIIPAALAETMLLVFEDKFIRKRLNVANTNIEKLEAVADLAAHYGFETWVPQAPVL